MDPSPTLGTWPVWVNPKTKIAFYQRDRSDVSRPSARGSPTLFDVEMQVRIPTYSLTRAAGAPQLEERMVAQALQRRCVWRHLWRLVGCYANVSIFDVDSPAQLHDILSTLPLFPFMDITVRALCRHPSAIADDEHLNKPLNT